ncbi:MAG: 2-phospho-L-lactate transferase, partial [Actinomycetota bacterium]
MRVTALAGGVGAARFLRGLTGALEPSTLTVIGNTGDDAVFHGLHISPDLDTVTYTLAGLVDPATGWGIRGDTTHALGQLETLGVDTWFRLGDRDIGTHLARTAWMAAGLPLSAVTDRMRRALGVEAAIVPMSDDPVRTSVVTAAGVVREFQEYFVRHRHEEDVAAVRFEGAARARPAPGVLEAIADADLVVVCPSNPVVSIAPILAVPGVREALAARREAVVGISPIVEGAALKGPAARLLPLTGAEVSASGVASLYTDICATFVVDRRDAAEAAKVEALGMRAAVLETVMETPEVARALAASVVS